MQMFLNLAARKTYVPKANFAAEKQKMLLPWSQKHFCFVDTNFASETYVSQFKGWFPYDRRRSRIADGRSQKVLRSSAIIWKHTSAIVCDPAIICDRLRSCDHMETKVLRSAIEMCPIIFLILTDDSTFLSHKARMFDYSNAHLL